MVLSFIPLSVRNFINVNSRLLIVIVPFAVMFVIGTMVDGTLPNLTPGITLGCLIGLFGVISEARMYRRHKETLANIYRPLMMRVARDGFFLALVTVMGVAEMLGYTHEKGGISALFILGIGTTVY